MGFEAPDVELLLKIKGTKVETRIILTEYRTLFSLTKVDLSYFKILKLKYTTNPIKVNLFHTF